jgi:hypothetical protein
MFPVAVELGRPILAIRAPGTTYTAGLGEAVGCCWLIAGGKLLAVVAILGAGVELENSGSAVASKGLDGRDCKGTLLGLPAGESVDAQTDLEVPPAPNPNSTFGRSCASGIAFGGPAPLFIKFDMKLEAEWYGVEGAIKATLGCGSLRTAGAGIIWGREIGSITEGKAWP